MSIISHFMIYFWFLIKASLNVYVEDFGNNFVENTFSLLICRPILKLTLVTYSWYKDGYDVQLNASNISFSENRLIFNDLNHRFDDGEYYCAINILKTNQKVYSQNRTLVRVKRNLFLVLYWQQNCLFDKIWNYR